MKINTLRLSGGEWGQFLSGLRPESPHPSNMEEFEVELNKPRGALNRAKIYYSLDEDQFVAYIYIGRERVKYAEMQKVVRNEREIKTYYEFGDTPDVGPKYMEAGDITQRHPIASLKDWKDWLEEYAKGIDPRDAFRYYCDVVGGF